MPDAHLDMVQLPTPKADAAIDELIRAHLRGIQKNSSDEQFVGFTAAIDVVMGPNAGNEDAEYGVMFGLLIAAVHRICTLEGYIERTDQ